jgi:hypothetical protein
MQFLYNCLFDTTEYSGYNDGSYTSQNQWNASFDHDQVSGAFRSWTLGGITDKVSDVYPTGFAHSYRLTCESASYWGFYQEIFKLSPGEKLDLKLHVRCDDATPTDGPDIAVFLRSERDPIFGGTPSIYSASLSVGADTWETFTVPQYTNSEAYEVEVVARVSCKDATAQCWAYVEQVAQYTDPGKENVLISQDYTFAGVEQTAELIFHSSVNEIIPLRRGRVF